MLKYITVIMNLALLLLTLWVAVQDGLPPVDRSEFWLVVLIFLVPCINIFYILIASRQRGMANRLRSG